MIENGLDVRLKSHGFLASLEAMIQANADR